MIRFIIIGVATYLIIVVVMYLAQRQLMYFPDTQRYDPAAAGLKDFSEIELTTGDGVELVAWYKAAAGGRPTIVIFQGNAGNIANRVFKARAFSDRGFGVLMPNYRGYGGSGGKPTEEGLVEDGRTAMRYLEGEGIEAAEIILHGESLGSGVAVALATQFPVAALVLEAPYTSLPDVAASAYPWLPVRYLLKDRFDSLSRIGDLNMPLFVVNGTDDEVIPARLGRELFEAANQPKSMVSIQGAHHNDVWELGGGAAMLDYLEKTFPRLLQEPPPPGE
ncbi:MAG: alpha/beta hydrolase [Sphingomonadales bacterium]